jgi:uncharacterized delta-60 repeat protein
MSFVKKSTRSQFNGLWGSRKSKQPKLNAQQLLSRAVIEALEGRVLLSLAPVITGLPSVNDGSSYTLNLHPNLTGTDAVQSWTINWGDGTVGSPDLQTVSDSPSSVSHTFAYSAQPYSISATVSATSGTYTANEFALDSTYAVNGTAQTPISALSSGTGATAIVRQSDGKIVAVGQGTDGDGNLNFLIARFNTDGSMDTSFGTDGVVSQAVGNSGQAYAVAIDSSGKIVVAGTSFDDDGNQDFAVARFNSDGSLDTSFGSDGVTLTPVGSQFAIAFAVTIQSDGKIVVAGQGADGGGNWGFAVARYNSDGTLDTSFGSSGIALTTVDYANTMVPDAVAINSAGKIIVSGTAYGDDDPGDTAVGIAEYNSDGSLDSSFGDDGFTLAEGIQPYAMALQSDDKIVIAGAGTGTIGNGSAIYRFNTDGTLDSSFGTGGQAFANNPDPDVSDQANAVAIQPDGKIVLAGYTNQPPDYYSYVSVTRYNSDGTLDTEFGNDGVITTHPPINGYGESNLAIGTFASCILLQPDGSLIVGAGTENNDSVGAGFGPFVLAKYTPSNTELQVQVELPDPPSPNVVAGDEQADISWQAMPNAVAYNVFRSTTSGSGYVQINSSPITGTSYVDTGLTDGVTYYYVLTSVDVENNQSVNSYEANATPAPPVVSASGAISSVAGAPYVLDLSAQAPADSSDDITSWTINWGDRPSYNPDVQTVTGNPSSVSHTFDYTGSPDIITATATDAAGNNIPTQTNQLDVTYGIDGVSAIPAGEWAGASSIAVQSDGKIVAAGLGTDSDGNIEFAVTRFNADGSIDTSFGTDGLVTLSIGSGDSAAQAVAIQSDGSIDVAGYALVDGQYGIALVQLNPDGSLDDSFGTDGIVTTGAAYSIKDGASGIALQANGQILVSGDGVDDDGNTEFAIARYNTDGSLDTSFGPDATGLVYTQVAGSSRSTCIAIGPDGQIVVGGVGYESGSYVPNFAMAQYNPDGSLAWSQMTPFSSDNSVESNIIAIAVQPDGQIVAGGSVANDEALARFNGSDGSLDTSFGDGGSVLGTDYNEEDINAVAILPNGQIMTAGDYYFERYNSDGSLDNTFAGRDFDATSASAMGGTSAMAVLPNGNILLAGGGWDSDTGLSTLLVSRYAPQVVVNVAAAPPALTISGEASVVSGGTYTLDLSAQFPQVDQNNDFIDSWTVNWGDGTTDSPDSETFTGNPSSVTHVYSVGPNSFDIQATATDTSGQVGYASTSVDCQLDGSFGSGGTASTAIDGSNYQPILQQTDGKFIVASTSSGGHFLLSRFNPDGTLDSTFGSDGVESTTISGTVVSAALDGSGNILLAGTSGNDLVLARFTSDGTPDSSFGSSGVVTTSESGVTLAAGAIAVQGNGKIVLTSARGTSGNLGVAVFQYNPDGSLYTGWGTGGELVVTGLTVPDNSPPALALLPNFGLNRILVGGRDSTDDGFAVACLNSNGTFTLFFGDNGIATANIGTASASVSALSVLSDGEILAGGNAGGGQGGLALFYSFGEPDSSFNGTGMAVVNSFNYSPNAIAQLASGTIVVPTASGVAAYNIDGSVDSTFGDDGVFTLSGSNSVSAIASADGRLVVAGYTTGGGANHIQLTRFVSTLDVEIDTVPPIPTNVIAGPASGGTLIVSWQQPPGQASGFIIQRQTDGGDWGQVGTTDGNTPSYLDSAVDPGSTYSYRIIATGNQNNSDPSAPSAPVSPGYAPGAPQDVTATADSDTSVQLTWTNPDDNADELLVLEESLSNFSSQTQLFTTVPEGTTEIEITGLTPYAGYIFSVAAANGFGQSNSDGVYVQMPGLDAPTDLTATAATVSTIQLNWDDDNGQNETGVAVELSTDGVNFTQIATLAAGATSYAVSSLSADTSYTFRVAALNHFNESDYSNTASATTPTTSVPDAPTSVNATISGSNLQVQWSSTAPNVQEYKVELSTDGINFTLADTVPASQTSDSVPDPDPSAPTAVRVVAVNSQGSSTPSTTASTIGSVTQLYGETDVFDGVDLSWNYVPNVDGFIISGSGAGSTIVPANTTNFIETGLTAGETYTFTVTPFKGSIMGGAHSTTVQVENLIGLWGIDSWYDQQIPPPSAPPFYVTNVLAGTYEITDLGTSWTGPGGAMGSNGYAVVNGSGDVVPINGTATITVDRDNPTLGFKFMLGGGVGWSGTAGFAITRVSVDTTIVSVTTPEAVIPAGATSITFDIHLSDPIPLFPDINFYLSGTALDGVDYDGSRYGIDPSAPNDMIYSSADQVNPTTYSVTLPILPGESLIQATKTLDLTLEVFDSTVEVTPNEQFAEVTLTPQITPQGAAGVAFADQELSHYTLGTLQLSSPLTSGDTLEAAVDWGDGQQSDASVVQDSSTLYSVLGDHTYDHEGVYTPIVEIFETHDSTVSPATFLAGYIDVEPEESRDQLQSENSQSTPSSFPAISPTLSVQWDEITSTDQAIDESDLEFSLTAAGVMTYSLSQSLDEAGEDQSPGLTISQANSSDSFTITAHGTMDLTIDTASTDDFTVSDYTIASVGKEQLSLVDTHDDLGDDHTTTLSGTLTTSQTKSYDSDSEDYTWTNQNHGTLNVTDSGFAVDNASGMSQDDGLTYEDPQELAWVNAFSGLVGDYTAAGQDTTSMSLHETGNYGDNSYTQTQANSDNQTITQIGNEDGQSFTQTYTPVDQQTISIKSSDGDSYTVTDTSSISAGLNLSLTNHGLTSTMTGTESVSSTESKTATDSTGDYSLSTDASDGVTYTESSTDGAQTSNINSTATEDYTDTNSGNIDDGTLTLTGTVSGSGTSNSSSIDGASTITTTSQTTPDRTMVESGALFADTLTISGQDTPTSQTTSTETDGSQTSTSDTTLDGSLNVTGTYDMGSSDYDATLVDQGSATATTTTSDQDQSSSVTTTGTANNTTTAAGNYETGDYTTTEVDAGTTTVISSGMNQGITTGSTETDLPDNTIITTGNDVAGDYTSSESDGGSTSIVSVSTNSTSTANSTETDLADETVSDTGNEISGDYLSTDINTGTSTIDSTTTNQDATNTATTSSHADTTYTELGDDLTGSYTTSETDQSSLSIVSVATNQGETDTSTETDAMDSTVADSGNSLTGSDASTEADGGTDTIISLETNLGQTDASTETDQVDSGIINTGNAITGDYTTTELDGGQSVIASLDINQGQTNSSTETDLPDTTIKTKGNDFTGDYTSTETDGGGSTIVSIATNQGQTSTSTETDLADTTVSGSGNEISGDYTTTDVDNGTSVIISLQTNHGEIDSSSESDFADNTVTASGNNDSGDYTSSEFDGGSSTVASISTNQSATDTSNETDLADSEITSSGNSISGDYTSTEFDAGSDTIISSSINHSQTVDSTETDEPDTTIISSGNEINSDYSINEKDFGHGVINSSMINQDQSSHSTETDLQNSTTTTTGHNIGGDYTTSEADSGQSAIVTTSENQGQTDVSTETSGASNVSVVYGNQITGLYSSTQVEGGADTLDSTETNQSLSIHSTAITHPVTTITSVGDNINGNYTTTEFDGGTETIASVSSNQDLTTTATETDRADTTVTDVGNDVTGNYTADEFDGGGSTIVTVSTNQDLNTTTTETDSNDDTSGTAGNTVTGSYATTYSGTDTSSVDEAGTAGSRTFVSTDLSTTTFSGTDNGNSVTGDDTVTEVDNSNDTATNNDTYADGSDQQTFTDLANSTTDSTSSNFTGDFTEHSTGNNTQTTAETGDRGNSYTLTATDISSNSESETGNSLVGGYTLSTSSSDSSDSDKSGDGFNVHQIADSSGSVVTTGNNITGGYTSTAIGSNTLATQETTSGAGQDATLTQTETTTSSLDQTGNSVNGTFNSTDHQNVSLYVSQTGVNSDGTFTVIENSFDTPVVVTDGNSIAGSQTITTTGDQNYGETQSNADGSDHYTLSQTGDKNYTTSELDDALDGAIASTQTGVDDYTLLQNGQNGAKDYTLAQIGADDYTVADNENQQTGLFATTTSGTDDYTQSETGTNSGTSFSVSAGATNSFSRTETGNAFAGSISLSQTGADRYAHLEQFNNTSDGANGGAGMTNFSPVGLSVMIARATIPAGTFADIGDAQYKYCFAKGTLVVMADGSTKAIEKIEPGEMVLASPESDPEAAPTACRVLETYHNPPAKLLAVTIASSIDPLNGEVIYTTAEHPFYVKERGWTKVKDLAARDQLRSHDGSWVKVRSVDDTGRAEPVFNFCVETSHTYFVVLQQISRSVLVHNYSWSDFKSDVVWSKNFVKAAYWDIGDPLYQVAANADDAAHHPVTTASNSYNQAVNDAAIVEGRSDTLGGMILNGSAHILGGELGVRQIAEGLTRTDNVSGAQLTKLQAAQRAISGGVQLGLLATTAGPYQGATGVLTGSLDALTAAERDFVNELLAQGKNVEIVARGAGKTPDFLVNGVSTELKTLTAAGQNTLKNAIEAAAQQGQQIIVDARNVPISPEEALAQIERAQGNIGGLKGRVTVLTSKGPVTY